MSRRCPACGDAATHAAKNYASEPAVVWVWRCDDCGAEWEGDAWIFGTSTPTMQD